MADDDDTGNFATFRDCLCGPLLEKSAIKRPRSSKRRTARGHRNSSEAVKGIGGHGEEEQSAADELVEFVDVSSTFIDRIAGC